MSGVSKVYGKLIVKDIPSNVCWESPDKFLKKITDFYRVDLDINSNVDFVVVGSETPSEDDKSRLWIKTYNNGYFAGLYKFEGGKWREISLHRPDEVVWFYGDSRNIPEGFKLIDEDNGYITSDNIKHIMSFYNRDTSIVGSTVYTYFACTYIGTTD